MAEKIKAVIGVVGREAEVVEFLHVLSRIQWCGNVGTCRTIPVTVDGDGSGQLRFTVVDDTGEEDLQSSPAPGDAATMPEMWIGG